MTSIEAEFLGYFPIPAGSGPTALQTRGDVSCESARASGGYRAWDGSQQVVMPECDCDCGLRLVAESKAEADIRAAVQIHQATEAHSRWRKEKEA